MIGGVFSTLAAYSILPQGVNAISNMGVIGQVASVSLICVGAIVAGVGEALNARQPPEHDWTPLPETDEERSEESVFGEPNILEEACLSGSAEDVVSALKQGVDPREGCPLWWALSASRGTGAMVIPGSPEIDQEMYDTFYRTMNVVRLLLECDINVNMRRESTTPLELALRGGHLLVANKLLDRGADASVGAPIWEALNVALPITVRALIAAGGDVNEGRGGTTPLELAVDLCDIKVVRRLIKAGARASEGYPLHRILSQPNRYPWSADIAELLIRGGADVNARSPEGVYPLEIASCLKCSTNVRHLVEGGADFSLGKPLWHALNSEHVALAKNHIRRMVDADMSESEILTESVCQLAREKGVFEELKQEFDEARERHLRSTESESENESEDT